MSDSSITHTVSAFFDDRGHADIAIDNLVDAGITRSAITLSEGQAGGKDGDRATISEPPKSFWDTLESFFFPDDDRHLYAEGLRRGGFLVTVSGLTLDQREAAADILDAEGTVDLDERSHGWRSEGWTPTAKAPVRDTSDFANSTFDQSDGTLVGGDLQDAFHSGRYDRATAPKPSAVHETPIPGTRGANDGRVGVRSYTMGSSIQAQPESPPRKPGES
jgi:hypothetical protein